MLEVHGDDEEADDSGDRGADNGIGVSAFGRQTVSLSNASYKSRTTNRQVCTLLLVLELFRFPYWVPA